MRKPVVVLDVRDPWLCEPFKALGELIPTVGLLPRIHNWRWLANQRCADFAKGWRQAQVYLPPRALGRLSNWVAPISEMCLRRVCPEPSAVVFTYPDQRAFASRFKGALRLYYAADNYATSYGWPAEMVASWERHIVDRVDYVIVISGALAELFQVRYGIEPMRLHLSPNAAPMAMIPEECPRSASPAPPPVPGSFRPLAGVLGTISSRIRLGWIRQAVEALPWLYWAFVGPVAGLYSAQHTDLAALQRHHRCCFTGYQPYHKLFSFASAFDVAVVPLEDDGISPTSSPVRLFTQLPFGQPILATPGCRQLEEFGPLVSICRNPQELIDALCRLREQHFDDGWRQARWLASWEHTWEQRAEGLYQLIKSAT